MHRHHYSDKQPVTHEFVKMVKAGVPCDTVYTADELDKWKHKRVGGILRLDLGQ